MANGITALFEGIEFHKLEVTKSIAITPGLLWSRLWVDVNYLILAKI